MPPGQGKSLALKLRNERQRGLGNLMFPDSEFWEELFSCFFRSWMVENQENLRVFVKMGVVYWWGELDDMK